MAPRIPIPTPTPVPRDIVCSVCGLDWNLHAGKKPDVMECIRLLKARQVRTPLWYTYPRWTGPSYYPAYTLTVGGTTGAVGGGGVIAS